MQTQNCPDKKDIKDAKDKLGCLFFLSGTWPTYGEETRCLKLISNILLIGPVKADQAPPWPDKDPFVLTPSDKSLAYVRARAKEIGELKQAIIDGEVTVLIGPIGSGKTTLCEQIITDLKNTLRETVGEIKNGPILPIFLPGAAFSKTEDFIHGILTELSIDVRGRRHNSSACS